MEITPERLAELRAENLAKLTEEDRRALGLPPAELTNEERELVGLPATRTSWAPLLFTIPTTLAAAIEHLNEEI